MTAIVEATDNLQLSFAYTYSDFEFDDFDTNPGVEGNDLPGLPENQLFAEVAYRHPSGFYVVGDVLYVDDLFANNSNTITNDDSTVANIRAGFTSTHGNWKVAPFIGINNLFDEEYNSNVRINGFGGRLFEPAPEVNVYAGITLDYEIR